MSSAPDIPPAVLARVADEIGRALLASDVAPPTASGAPGLSPFGVTVTTGMAPAAAGLAESFEVWRLDLGKVRDATETGATDLPAAARPDTRWHHQVRTLGDRPTHYARSSRREEEQGALLALFESGLAARIDAAIDLLDASLPDTGSSVRLLLLPELYVATLWVVPPDERRTTVVLVQAPHELGLRELELLPGPVLLAALQDLDRAVPLHPDRDPTHSSFDR